MGTSATIEGFIAAMELKESPNSGKTYGLITVKEDTGYAKGAGWVKTGVNTYKIRVRGEYRLNQASHLAKGDRILATLSAIEIQAFIGSDGEARAVMVGNSDTIAMISRKADRPSSPREQAKDAANQSRQKMRTEREQGAEPTEKSATPPAVKGGKRQTSKDYRADQSTRGKQAETLNQAQKAQQARNTAKPQPTDETACKKCAQPFQRRDLTKAGYCPSCKGTRRPATSTAPKPTAPTEVDQTVLVSAIYADSRA
ncbi:hypothetical protein AB0C84_40480 [Actinomadura sp. NPDC048955]|uniref:hypothetical protein n=1 Tax=Actinomadura sp. NPDC048955 TaxID=3158228 RepID=UPI0034040F34